MHVLGLKLFTFIFHSCQWLRFDVNLWVYSVSANSYTIAQIRIHISGIYLIVYSNQNWKNAIRTSSNIIQIIYLSGFTTHSLWKIKLKNLSSSTLQNTKPVMLAFQNQIGKKIEPYAFLSMIQSAVMQRFNKIVSKSSDWIFSLSYKILVLSWYLPI